MTWDDDEDLKEDVDDDEQDDDDLDETTRPCPYCRAEIFDDTVRCPECGRYLSAEDAPREPRPWWLVLGVAACVTALLWWLLRF